MARLLWNSRSLFLTPSLGNQFEKESLAEYIKKKRELFLVQYSLGVKNEEVCAVLCSVPYLPNSFQLFVVCRCYRRHRCCYFSTLSLLYALRYLFICHLLLPR